MSVSIIGLGNFGKFIVKHLTLAGLDLTVTDVIDKTKEAKEIGAKFVSIDEACKSSIIILAVPMESLEEILHNIKSKLTPKTIVLDVCSLKMFSSEAMKRILPREVEIIGTHPLFGPQSAKDSINGMNIALCKVRCKEATFCSLVEFCKKLNLKTIVTTPEEHDKQMAISQALTHFICKTLNEIKINRIEMSTRTFDKLIEITDIIKNDTPALFNNMQTMNPFAKEVRNKFIKQAEEINAQLNHLNFNKNPSPIRCECQAT